MILTLIRFVQSNETSIEVINYKFLVSAHSFLPNDSDFASAELVAKDKSICLPHQWHESRLVNAIKIHDSELNNEKFFSIKLLEKTITK